MFQYIKTELPDQNFFIRLVAKLSPKIFSIHMFFLSFVICMDFNLWVMSPTPLNYPMKEKEKNIFSKANYKRRNYTPRSRIQIGYNYIRTGESELESNQNMKIIVISFTISLTDQSSGSSNGNLVQFRLLSSIIFDFIQKVSTWQRILWITSIQSPSYPQI